MRRSSHGGLARVVEEFAEEPIFGLPIRRSSLVGRASLGSVIPREKSGVSAHAVAESKKEVVARADYCHLYPERELVAVNGEAGEGGRPILRLGNREAFPQLSHEARELLSIHAQVDVDVSLRVSKRQSGGADVMHLDTVQEIGMVALERRDHLLRFGRNLPDVDQMHGLGGHNPIMHARRLARRPFAVGSPFSWRQRAGGRAGG
jgi:hypothetical protein